MNLHPSSVLFVAGVAVYVGIRAHFRQIARAQKTSVRRSSRRDMSLVMLVGLCQVVLPLIFVFSPWLDRLNYGLPGAANVAGVIPLLGGLWLFWRSHTDLGRSWSVTLELRESHRLVTEGVYRLIRHPMYASFFLLALEQALLLGNWLAGWSALAAVLLLYVVRVPAEEAMMLSFFGAEYQSYMRRTGGIIPRLWRMHGA